MHTTNLLGPPRPSRKKKQNPKTCRTCSREKYLVSNTESFTMLFKQSRLVFLKGKQKTLVAVLLISSSSSGTTEK